MSATADEALQVLASLARARAGPEQEAYLVGGSVRDALLGRAVRDLDVSARDAPVFAADVALALGSRVVDLGAAPHPLYRVPVAGGEVDITPLRGTLLEDLVRRDFTVNAMALPLGEVPRGGLPAIEAGVVLDPHGVRDDLASRTLRAVRPAAFLDDPVRALRAARLMAELGFTLEPATAGAIPAALPALRAVAPERGGAELLRLFTADRSAAAVRVMEATGLLDTCFPELAEGREVEQRPSHAYRVLEHQIVAFEHVDSLLAASPPAGDEHGDTWRTFWDAAPAETRWGALRVLLERQRAEIKLATLLHDVGKPRTLTVQPDGRTRFFGHAETGARLAASRLTAWRLPSTLVERVALLIEQHLRPGQVASPGEPPTARALHRFHQALGDATPDVCLLFLADSLATAPAAVMRRWPAYVGHVRRIIEWRPPPRAEAIRRLVDGHAVMSATGLRPGPALGRVLAALDEAAAAGEVSTPDEALTLTQEVAGRIVEGT